MRWDRAGKPEGGPPPVKRKPKIRICVIEGCGDRVNAHDWCSRHLKRWYRAGRPESGPPADPPPRMVCARSGCTATAKDGPWCVACTKRWEKAGRPPQGPPPPRKKKPVPPTCSVKGCRRKGYANGRCESCDTRWRAAGRPAEDLEPTPERHWPMPFAERVAEYEFLRDGRVSVEDAAARVGVTNESTVKHYEARYQQKKKEDRASASQGQRKVSA